MLEHENNMHKELVTLKFEHTQDEMRHICIMDKKWQVKIDESRKSTYYRLSMAVQTNMTL
jgi:hypothetical protein